MNISFAKFGQAQSWRKKLCSTIPICSMHGISTHIYPKNQPNVGKYSIHGASGTGFSAGSLFQHRKLPTESHLEKKTHREVIMPSPSSSTSLWGRQGKKQQIRTNAEGVFKNLVVAKGVSGVASNIPLEMHFCSQPPPKKRMKSIEILENYWNILQPSTQNCTTGVTALPVC